MLRPCAQHSHIPPLHAQPPFLPSFARWQRSHMSVGGEVTACGWRVHCQSVTVGARRGGRRVRQQAQRSSKRGRLGSSRNAAAGSEEALQHRLALVPRRRRRLLRTAGRAAGSRAAARTHAPRRRSSPPPAINTRACRHARTGRPPRWSAGAPADTRTQASKAARKGATNAKQSSRQAGKGAAGRAPQWSARAPAGRAATQHCPCTCAGAGQHRQESRSGRRARWRGGDERRVGERAVRRRPPRPATGTPRSDRAGEQPATPPAAAHQSFMPSAPGGRSLSSQACWKMSSSPARRSGLGFSMPAGGQAAGAGGEGSRA